MKSQNSSSQKPGLRSILLLANLVAIIGFPVVSFIFNNFSVTLALMGIGAVIALANIAFAPKLKEKWLTWVLIILSLAYLGWAGYIIFALANYL